jgi:transcriptional regulator with XRE-family HTH domain
MTYPAHTLGRFVADLMQKQHHNNSSLAQAARVSESAVRNLLKVGTDPRAKDPDARTLRKVADALGVDPLKLFRLAGYIPAEADRISVRAEYLGVLFDRMPPEKQDAVLSLFEALADRPQTRENVQAMRRETQNALAGIDLSLPGALRVAANQLIRDYQMTEVGDVLRIEPSAQVFGTTWEQLPDFTRERLKALIVAKLDLRFDPTMVDETYRK